MSKEVKTNAMRILDKNKVSYEYNLYECDEFVDGVSVADMLGQSYDTSFKTLVTVGKSSEHYVFVIPIDKELDLKKAAKTVGDKSVEMIPVKNILSVTGYIRGGCTPIGLKKKYPTVFHSTLTDYEKVIISAGKIGAQIIINPTELLRVTDGRCADIIKEI